MKNVALNIIDTVHFSISLSKKSSVCRSGIFNVLEEFPILQL